MQLSKRRFLIIGIVLVVIVFLAGPQVTAPKFDHELPIITSDLKALEDSILNAESAIEGLKPDNQARIIWADSIEKQKTPVAIVYLHGFTASQEEGNPVHHDFAKTFGCNLYLSRLDRHGIANENPLLNLTAENLYADAVKAIAIGHQLGEEVIIMSTSTGGTLALFYASKHDGIKGLINYSPNVRIRQKSTALLTWPWGLQLARLSFGGLFNTRKCDDYEAQYWGCHTRLEAIVQLQSLIDNTMHKETFESISIPVFNGLYYKNETEQDQTVSVDAIRKMHDELGTSDQLKRLIDFPDAQTHVIVNGKKSKSWKQVSEATVRFAEEVLLMKQLQTDMLKITRE